MGVSLVIRLARIADAPGLAQAEREIAAEPGLLVSQPGEIPESAYVQKIESLASTGCYIVAEHQGQVAGHAYLDPMGLQAISHVFRLTVVVHRNHQGRGIGRALVEHLLDWASRDSRVGKVELLVRATNHRALALYRKLGFEEEGRLRNRVRLPDGTFINDISMGWFPSR
jgi:RimJ/RimL family protein N-acetyltransferase